MASASAILDRQFLEMRWRCLSLAADLDRVEKSDGGEDLAKSDKRLQELREAIAALLTAGTNRAEKVQTIFSDRS